MENVTNEIRLHSISDTARMMGIGKEQLYGLLDEGRIGYISIGKSRKIPHTEIVNFIKTNTVYGDGAHHDIKTKTPKALNRQSAISVFEDEDLGGDKILENLMKDKNNGNS